VNIEAKHDPPFSSGAVFVFLSGLGSGTADLLPLSKAFERAGCLCEHLDLPINVTDDRPWSAADILSAVPCVEAALKPHVERRRSVFLVGFSLGATVALLYAAQHECSGIVAISAFFAPPRPRLARIFFACKKALGQPDMGRIPQVTRANTKAELDLRSSLPIDVIGAATAMGRMALERMPDIRCPVLFFHSFDDRVAGYVPVAKALRCCGAGVKRLISFNHLNHYIQFDIRPSDIVALSLRFFDRETTPSVKAERPEDAKIVSDLLKMYTDERRHWSQVLFQTIIGFFTAFSLLLFNSLSDIVTNTPRAPYFLVSYSLASSIYLTLSILYFFYANRVDVYLKFHVEPMMPGTSWAAFRSSKWMTGGASYRVTRLATIPLTVFPSLVSFLSLGGCAVRYWNKLADLTLHYSVLKILFLLAVGLAAYTIHAIRTFNRFTMRWLYIAQPADASDLETEGLLMRLYQSVSPGSVRQPGRPPQ
jgi:pimeloyl-ACP methyl ester carboxylesterase